MSGTLASVLMPTTATGSYNPVDQVKTWNSNQSVVNPNGSINTDPSNGNTFGWDPRNELIATNGGSEMYYDPYGRRENLPSGFAGSQISPGPQSYVYDGGLPVQSIGNSGSTINYLRDDGGETVAESWDGSAAQIPLRDAAGSTIAMVDTASGNLATSYSYTPTGAVSRTGSGYVTPYQFGGTENDTFAYYSGGSYYSATLGRPLALKPPLTSSGGTDTGMALPTALTPAFVRA